MWSPYVSVIQAIDYDKEEGKLTFHLASAKRGHFDTRPAVSLNAGSLRSILPISTLEWLAQALMSAHSAQEALHSKMYLLNLGDRAGEKQQHCEGVRIPYIARSDTATVTALGVEAQSPGGGHQTLTGELRSAVAMGLEDFNAAAGSYTAPPLSAAEVQSDAEWWRKTMGPGGDDIDDSRDFEVRKPIVVDEGEKYVDNAVASPQKMEWPASAAHPDDQGHGPGDFVEPIELQEEPTTPLPSEMIPDDEQAGWKLAF
jgi:hypothetical protein